MAGVDTRPDAFVRTRSRHVQETETQLVLRLIDKVFNDGDLALVDELVHSDFFDHEAPASRSLGREGIRASVRALHEAFAGLPVRADGCCRSRRKGRRAWDGERPPCRPDRRNRGDRRGMVVAPVSRLSDRRAASHRALGEPQGLLERATDCDRGSCTEQRKVLMTMLRMRVPHSRSLHKRRSGAGLDGPRRPARHADTQPSAALVRDVQSQRWRHHLSGIDRKLLRPGRHRPDVREWFQRL